MSAVSADTPPLVVVRAAHAVVLAFGWKRAFIAFGAGAASALSVAPVNAWPVLFVTFPVLVWLIDGSTAGRRSAVWSAAIAGWCFGFGYFLFGLYWIGYAFLVDAKTFGWLLPVAVAGLPAYLAIYTALGAALARLLWVRGPLRLITLGATMTMAEWLRGHLLSGFPWNTFGYALTEPLPLAQSVSVVGIWGLTFLAIAICATPAVLADERSDTPAPWRPLIIGLVVLAGFFGECLAPGDQIRLVEFEALAIGGTRLHHRVDMNVPGVRVMCQDELVPRGPFFQHGARGRHDRVRIRAGSCREQQMIGIAPFAPRKLWPPLFIDRCRRL